MHVGSIARILAAVIRTSIQALAVLLKTEDFSANSPYADDQ